MIFGIFAKFNIRRVLVWAICVLLVITTITTWSVSGVYAKYIYGDSINGSAGVAHMGVIKFELTEHKFIDISNDLKKVAEYDRLYMLDLENTVTGGEGNTYTKVIPGVDIPKDPFINLVLDSNEVSYELYLKVEEKDFPTTLLEDGETRVIDYWLTADWEKADDNKDQKSGLYKFVGTIENVINNGFFAAGTKYTFQYSAEKTNNTSIRILEDNIIKVSEHFNSEPDINNQPTQFSLTFTAYLQQVINVSAGGSDVEDANNG